MAGCKHTQQVHERADVIESYELAVKLLGSHVSKEFYCSVKGCIELSPCRVCLECPFVGCKKHGKEHAGDKGHYLSVDLVEGSEGSVYCYACEDYIPDEVFERRKNSHQNGTVGVLPPYQATTGLRGFYNMGATCFMSVILQSFVHNPVMRNFFLCGGHDSSQCPRRQAGLEGECLACSVDEVFTDFFRDNNAQGYGLTNVLVASWKVKRALAGASEQDAHEFLQFILDEFHKTHFQSKVLEQKENKNVNGDGGGGDIECPCVAHRTFCGELESRIQCHNCGNVTSKVDPMMDLSLEVKSQVKSKVTLKGCLDKFTSTEKLDAKYHCSVCDAQQNVDKSLYIKRMPVSLCIQLKRFEHGLSKQGGSKVEVPVEFPLYLDFAKYVSDVPKHSSLNYELYGVVCHQGSLHSGHYTCYMKNRLGNWFHFDDAMVTAVSAKNALAAKDAYLLFYIINRL